MNSLLFLLAVAIAGTTNATKVLFPAGLNFNTIARRCAGIVGCVSVALSSPHQDARAIPALEAATRAMISKTERVVEDRDISSLPESGKKRKALALCKEYSSRNDAGYSSASSCTETVMRGDYNNILNGVSAGKLPD